MHKIRSYSSPLALGHKLLENFWQGEVIVQEKIDGSQFSFGKTEDGELLARSRRQQIIVSDKYVGMFKLAVQTVLEIAEALVPDWTYRGEFLAKTKHNTLRYERVPRGHIILYDVDMGDQNYLNVLSLDHEAGRIGLEAVSTIGIYDKTYPPSALELTGWLNTDSLLGGVKVEGIVFKNYNLYGRDQKVMMAKHVSPSFQERHGKDWKERNPSQTAFVAQLIEEFATEARWRKGIAHLQEQELLEGVPQDIPLVLREVSSDVHNEYGDEIKERLFKHFWPKISRGLTRGLPEFYKQHLLDESIPGGDE